MNRLAAAVLALVLAACSPDGPKFQASDVTGSSFGREFSLQDPAGKTRTLAETMKLLGPDADRVQVVFITVDPERDTPALLAEYVPAFDKRFLGLSGNAEATERVAKEFKVIYQKQPGATPTTYTMDHSAGVFLFDPQGRLRLYARNGQGPDAFAHDLRELLRASSAG